MAVFPTSIAADADLFIAKNNLGTTLNGAIDNSTTTVILTDASSFPTAGYVTIDSEAIKYTGKSTNTLTGVTRGADGTTAASHANGAQVDHCVVANHHNALKDEIIAIETSLDFTVSRAMTSNGSGRLAVSSVTATELGYVSGVTSAIQTQLNAKAPSASPTFSGTITTPLTASRALVTGSSSELAVSAVTATELGYVSGVTSAIQTQLNLLAPKASPTFTGTVTLPNAAITDTSNQLVLGATRTVTITAPTPASSSRTWTIPDLSTSPTFAALEGTQTFSGVKTFSATAAFSQSDTDVVGLTITNTNNASGTTTSAGLQMYVTNSVGTTSAIIKASESGVDTADCDLVFLTSATTGGTPSEKMRIAGAAPRVGINTAPVSGMILALSDNNSTYTYTLRCETVGNNTDYVGFRSAGAEVGSIKRSGGSNVSYNTSSDARLKTNIVNAPSALDVLSSIRVRSFDWKLDQRHVTYGVIAQELYEVFPDPVSPGKDDVKESPWQVDQTRLVPLMVKAIQEIMERLEKLEKKKS